MKLRKFASASVVLALSVLGLTLALQIDDNLEPGARQWIADVEQRIGSVEEPYLLLLGMGVAADEEPRSVALAHFEKYEALIADADTLAEGIVLDAGELHALAHPEGAMFCPDDGALCPALLETETDTLTAVLHEHSALLQRYRELLQHPVVITPTTPHLIEPYPPISYTMSGQRLHHMSTLLEIRQGAADTALRRLLDEHYQLRSQLAHADSIVFKLVMVAMLERNLELLAHIRATQPETRLASLPRLTRDERSLELPMARELAMVAYLYRGMDRHPQFFSTTEDSLAQPAPAWLVRALFKPNMSTNNTYHLYRAVADLSLKPVADDAESAKVEVHELELGWWSTARNAAGSILSSIAQPERSSHIERIHALDRKIQELNTAGASSTAMIQ